MVWNEPVDAQCRIDGGSPVACTEGVTPFTLSEGDHTLDARAADKSGNLSGFSAQHVFKIVDTAINGGPGNGETSGPNVSFLFSTGAGIGWDCELDFGGFSDCGGTFFKAYNGLPTGQHTFRVRAKNGGYFDHVPAVRTWTVDATPPDTSVTGGPGDPDEGEDRADPVQRVGGVDVPVLARRSGRERVHQPAEPERPRARDAPPDGRRDRRIRKRRRNGCDLQLDGRLRAASDHDQEGSGGEHEGKEGDVQVHVDRGELDLQVQARQEALEDVQDRSELQEPEEGQAHVPGPRLGLARESGHEPREEDLAHQ